MTFTEENTKKLDQTCRKISNLMKEQVNGQFMHSQLSFLGELIKEFKENPIVANSGIIKT